MKPTLLFLGGLLAFASPGTAFAQGQPLSVYVVPSCGTGISGYAPTQNRLATQDTSGKLCVTGDGPGGSSSGFTPNGNYSLPLAVSTSSANTLIPSGQVIAVSNVGSTIAYINLGTTSGTAATTSGIPVQPGATLGITVGLNTYLAAITSSSTTTLNIAGGIGLVTGFGGGGQSGSVSPMAPAFVIQSGTTNVATTSYGAYLWASATTGAKNQSIYTCDSTHSNVQLIVKDEIGTANTYAITVTPLTGTINNGSAYVMNFGFQSITLTCDGAGNWALT